MLQRQRKPRLPQSRSSCPATTLRTTRLPNPLALTSATSTSTPPQLCITLGRHMINHGIPTQDTCPRERKGSSRDSPAKAEHTSCYRGASPAKASPAALAWVSNRRGYRAAVVVGASSSLAADSEAQRQAEAANLRGRRCGMGTGCGKQHQCAVSTKLSIAARQRRHDDNRKASRKRPTLEGWCVTVELGTPAVKGQSAGATAGAHRWHPCAQEPRCWRPRGLSSLQRSSAMRPLRSAVVRVAPSSGRHAEEYREGRPSECKA